MKTIFCRIIDVHNIGDQLACPIDYFPAGKGCQREEKDVREDPKNYTADAIIFGAGGMLHQDADVWMEKICESARQLNPKVKLVVWGIGTNYHGRKDALWPPFLHKLPLVGLRDRGNPFSYVACPTCLHPAFNQTFSPPDQEVVVYHHWEHPLTIEGPSMSNDQPKENIGKVLAFLASGRLVVTNTYHGAYWAALLNRPVVIVDAFSNRFFCGLPLPIPIATPQNYREMAVGLTPREDGSSLLRRCRQSNLDFFGRVKTLVGSF